MVMERSYGVSKLHDFAYDLKCHISRLDKKTRANSIAKMFQYDLCCQDPKFPIKPCSYRMSQKVKKGFFSSNDVCNFRLYKITLRLCKFLSVFKRILRTLKKDASQKSSIVLFNSSKERRER